MRTVFADSFFYFAYLNPLDRGHGVAMASAALRIQRIITTDYVLLELADGLSSPRFRRRTVEFVRALMKEPTTVIVPAQPELLARALDLYEARPDKAWSLTDCTSFVVMQDMGIAEALTGDVHFEQAGFRAMLKAGE